MACPKPDARPGATLTGSGVDFSVWSGSATAIWLCLFENDREVRRLAMARDDSGVFSIHFPGLAAGAHYGYRADGPDGGGHCFDPGKLLIDPYARQLDRYPVWDPQLAAPRSEGVDTADLMPKSIVTRLPEPLAPAEQPLGAGALIYELQVRGFTMLHPDVPEALRGTVAALGHPSVIAHLKRIGVGAVELMPISCWIDERHLQPLSLRNAWGYNPVAFMAPDPRICPGGIAELQSAVKKLHDAGIHVLLDVVFNHTGESDHDGPVLSLRGLDNRTYFRHEPDGQLVNDTGCGNTLACDHPATRRLILDTMRYFVEYAGIDGFRFDLAPILGRDKLGFRPDAELLDEMTSDPVLGKRVLVAEPWDIGPGGYQLGNFTGQFLEWNDQYRDRIRRFWRGDSRMMGELATSVSGSSDVFTGTASRSVSFIAAHDGFSLADIPAHSVKHNHANGENNRDGHNENYSWNNGTEGQSNNPAILATRKRDIRALLTTLFASRGTIMLTAGDEFGRTQGGNNNAYAQDNPTTWLNWADRDHDLLEYCAQLSAFRQNHPELSQASFLTGEPDERGMPDVEWLRPDGRAMQIQDWENEDQKGLVMILRGKSACRIGVLFNQGKSDITVALPTRAGFSWETDTPCASLVLGARSVWLIEENRSPQG